MQVVARPGQEPLHVQHHLQPMLELCIPASRLLQLLPRFERQMLVVCRLHWCWQSMHCRHPYFDPAMLFISLCGEAKCYHANHTFP